MKDQARGSLANPYIERGAEVTCPNCHKPIARVVRSIHQGDTLTSSHFQGNGIHFGSPMKCVDCGMPWYLKETQQIHLKDGWVPQLS